MKPAYSSVNLFTGAVNPGICKIQVAPREWLDEDIVIDFSTGKVTTAVTLITGRNWMELSFIQDSYEYNEKAKSNKSGTYYEVTAEGIINYEDADLQQVKETLRYNQFICLVTDRNKNIKIVGSQNSGMTLTLSATNQNKQTGQQFTTASFFIEAEELPPYYDI